MAAPIEDTLLRLHETDNVAVLKRAIRAGTAVAIGANSFVVSRDIPASHKVAISEIPPDAPIRKYGQVIGFTRGRVAPGDHVHTHNVVVRDFGRDFQFCTDARLIQYYGAEQMRHFPGYA